MVVVQDPIFQPMERDLFLAREAYFLRNAVLTFLGGHQLLNVENYYFKALLAIFLNQIFMLLVLTYLRARGLGVE